MRYRVGSVAALVLMAGATTASAQVFNSQPAFVSALATPFYLESFDSVPTNIGVASLSFGPVSGYAYTVSVVGAGGGAPVSANLYNGVFGTDAFISTDNESDLISVVFSGSPVFAFGANFWATDINFNAVSAQVTVKLADGSTEAFVADVATTFRGFVSTTPIASFTVDAGPTPPGGTGFAWPTMNNLYVGRGNTGPACYANCDGSTVPPVLNAGDFGCFLSKFREASSLSAAAQVTAYANCDASTVPPILNAGDFGCFLTKFRAGCP